VPNNNTNSYHDVKILIEPSEVGGFKQVISFKKSKVRGAGSYQVSMHLRVTARRHFVNFINYGIYDKRTEMNCLKLNFRDFRHKES
jgi:hypothetical protein